MTAVKGHEPLETVTEPAAGSRPQLEGAQRRRFARSLTRAKPARPAVRPQDLRDIREGQKTGTVLRRDAFVRRSLAVADVAAAALAVGVAVALADNRPRPALVLAPFFIVLFCKLARLYDRDEHVVRKSTLDQAPSLFQAATTYVLIASLASDALVDGGLGRPEVAAMWGLLLVALVALRVVARRVAARVTTPERVLVLGGKTACERLRSRFERGHSLNAVLVGRVAIDRDDRDQPTSLGPLEDLDFVLRTHRVERVIIAPGDRTQDEQLDIIRLVKALGVKVSVLPRLFEVVGSSMEFDDVDGITVIGLRRYGLSKTSWYVKRTFDVTVAGTGLILIAPLFALIAAAVKLGSPGPVLFRQPRVGRGGAHFEMLKFRTMYDGADEDKAKLAEQAGDDGLFKLVDDPRVTGVGRFLRRTSLDELPQLVNVIRGEMSLVGPRPLIEEEDSKIAGWNHRRREGTPGMTGVWQVLGTARVPLDDMVKMDYLYRANWSLWLDMKILLRTFAHVVSRRGL